MFTFLRRYWVAVVVLLAIAASFYANDQESSARDRTQHNQIVDTCVRGSERTARQAAYQFRTAEARRESGQDPVSTKTHTKASMDYDAYAEGNLESIPVPAGVKPGDHAVIETRRAIGSQGKPIYVLTGRALALQREGCERVNR